MEQIGQGGFGTVWVGEAIRLHEEALMLGTMKKLAKLFRANGDVAKAEALEKEMAAAKTNAKSAGK